MSALDPRALRDAFGRFMTGVTVVTTRGADGAPVGFTANSFSSVSLDPPLLLVCPGRFLSSFETFRTCETFAVSVLAEGQQEVSNTFASFKGDRFARIAHNVDCHGIPVIDGAVARFSCRTHRVVEAGDHVVLLGEVAEFDARDLPGLGYLGGQYFSLGLERRAREARASFAGAILQLGDRVLLEKTDSGVRPTQMAQAERHGVSEGLARHLAGLGYAAKIGPVYSVFDDPESGVQYAYLLATAAAADAGPAAPGLAAVPISDLTELTYTTPAIAAMMRRFAREAQTRDFTLYLGDVTSGDTHVLSERT